MVLQFLSAASIATAISVAFLNNNSFSNSNLLRNGSLARPHTNRSHSASSKIGILLRLCARLPGILLLFHLGFDFVGETYTSPLLWLA